MLLLRIKARSQIRRDDRAQIIAAAEEPIADTRNEIIHKVAQAARNCTQYFCEDFPAAAQAFEDVKRSIRAHEEGAFSSQDNEAVGKVRAAVRRDARLKCFPLQRSKSEGGSRAVVLKDELHGAMA